MTRSRPLSSVDSSSNIFFPECSVNVGFLSEFVAKALFLYGPVNAGRLVDGHSSRAFSSLVGFSFGFVERADIGVPLSVFDGYILIVCCFTTSLICSL
jgi:hypothetical protein